MADQPKSPESPSPADFAHDLNNLMGVIQGYSEKILREAGDSDSLKKCGEQILGAIRRGVWLSDQLAGNASGQAPDACAAQDFEQPAENRANKGCCVMAVEDDREILEMYEEIFKLAGYRYHLFPACGDAMAFYERHHGEIDVVLLDMVMPGMDGRECFKRLKGLNPGVKVVLLSGYAPNQDVQAMVEQGVRFLRKPVRADVLTAEIEAVAGDRTQAESEAHFEEGAEAVIIDDDRFLAGFLKDHLLEKGRITDLCYTPDACLDTLEKKHYRLAVVDYKLPGMDGLTLIRKIRDVQPKARIIMLTGIANANEIRKSAEKAGVDHFLKKPPDLAVLDEIIDNAFVHVRRKVKAREESGASQSSLLVGDSPAMRDTVKLIERLAAVDANVTIFGETGTGKELAARSLHALSARREQPFIPINCASLPETLLESELFGHEKGAFTGAHQAKKGLFEWADKGVIFLDEIGDMDLNLQAKLLRVIQDKRIRRVGGMNELPVDVRIISATNKNLEKMIVEGSFREDLFYRLNVVRLEMPSLRDRREDVPLLVRHFLEKFHGREPAAKMKKIAPEAVECLTAYAWPGNVREMENVVSGLVIMGKGPAIELDDIPDRIRASRADSPVHQDVPLSGYLEKAKKEYVVALLRKYGGNVVRCAKHAGVNRASFHRMLQALKVSPEGFRPNA